ncbi:hypothetical protein KIW84_066015 [Lathyrus oleraceus]|uniref:CCHC-type domain-containing protein n=1 Tax=Pisum sativum TaxID=3888 RepID=A0A9D5AAJ4_PEA|nr:hypothetical protein KIW84_066015 [Pisum sativum]
MEKSLELRDFAGLTQDVIELVFELVVDFRTYSFLRNWNRRSGSPPTAENAENSAFCLVLAQEQLLSCVNRLTQGVNRIEMAGRGRDDAAIAEALGMLAGVLGGNPNVVGMGAARQLNGAQKWLKEIERIFRVTECADNQKVRFGTHMLSEEADDWWVATRTELESAGNTEITWVVFRERFLRKYFPEDLSKYYTPYNEAAGEFSKCVKFENGLRPEIKQAIGYQRIRVFSDLVDCCRIFEQDSKARAESYQQRVDRKGKNQNDRGKPYAAGKGFQRQSGMKRPSGGDFSAPAKCYRCGQAGHRFHECASVEKKCFKCGKGGHLAAECRLKTLTCFNCGEVGHISPQCPKPKKENQSGGKIFALSGSETSADDRLIRGTLW